METLKTTIVSNNVFLEASGYSAGLKSTIYFNAPDNGNFAFVMAKPEIEI